MSSPRGEKAIRAHFGQVVPQIRNLHVMMLSRIVKAVFGEKCHQSAHQLNQGVW